MGQAPHLRNWVIGKGVQMSQMEKCESDREVGVRFYVACILPVGIQPCSRLDKNGGTSNPDAGNSSNDRS